MSIHPKLLIVLLFMSLFLSNKCQRTQNGGFQTGSSSFQYPIYDDVKKEDVFVLCKRARRCDDGTYEDAVVSRKVCQQMLTMQQVVQCRLEPGQKIDKNRDIGCDCSDVCPQGDYQGLRMNVLNEASDNLTTQDIYGDSVEQPKDREGKYKLNMGLNNISHKLNKYIEFDSSKKEKEFKSEEEALAHYKKAIKEALSGKITKIDGLGNLSEAVNKSPFIKTAIRDELEKMRTQGTGELNQKWQKVVAKDKNNDIDVNHNMRMVERNLKRKRVTSHRKVSIATKNNDMIVGTIVPFDEETPFKSTELENGTKRKVYCLLRTDIPRQEDEKCQTKLVDGLEGMKLIPGDEKVDKLYLEEYPDDEQNAYDKAQIQKCYEYTGCRDQEDRIEEVTPDNSGSTGGITTSPTSTFNGEPTVLWDECDGSNGVTGSYVGRSGRAKCSKRKMSAEFSKFYGENVKKCADYASMKMGLSSAASVHVDHAGITGDPRHSSRSNHAVNRAIDIKGFEMTMPDGTKKYMKYGNAKKANSFESKYFPHFRACWSQKMKEYKSNCPGTDPKGTIGHEDHDHGHHLHLSLPYCPRKGNYYVK